MKKVKLISIVAIIVLAMNMFAGIPILAQESEKVEFVVNGGFENLNSDGKPTGWSFTSKTIFGTHAGISTDAKSDGAQSLQFKGTTDQSAGKAMYQIYEGVATNETCTLSLKYRVDSYSGTGAAGRVNVYFLDENNKTLSSVYEDITTVDGTWHTLTKEFDTPYDMVKVQLYLRMYGDAVGYYDSVSLKAPTEPEKIEHVVNGGFENLDSDGKPEGWAITSLTIFGEHAAVSTDVKADDTQSLQFKGSSTVNAGKAANQIYEGIAPGKTYTLSFKYRIDSYSGSGVAGRVNVYFLDENNKQLSYITEDLTTVDGQWQTLTKKFKTPENMVKLQLYLRMYGDSVGYYDSVSLTGPVKPQECKIYEPLAGATNMIVNGSFETLVSGKPSNWSISDSHFGTKIFIAQDEERGNILHYKSSDSDPTRIYQIVEGFEPGATYQVSAWLKTINIPSTGTRKGPSFAVDMYDANENRITSDHAYNFSPTYGTWQQVAYQFTVPEETASIYFYPKLFETGELYYDDIEVYKIAEKPVVTMDTTHVFYTEWNKGVINLDYNSTISTGSYYNIKIKKDDEELLSDSVPVSQAHQEYSFNINLLSKYGEEYTLEVSCTDAGGNVVWSETKDIYRFDRPTSLTEDQYPLDGNGNAFYPALGYTVYYEDVELMKEVGINVVSGGVSNESTTENPLRVGPNPTDREFTRQWLDTMWENGIMTMVCLYPNNGKFASDSYIANVLDFIEDLGDHPGILGYLVQDEPFNDWDVEKTTENLKKVYLAIRRADDKHIVAHVANRERFWDICTDWSDMIICDRYPTEDYFRNLQYNFLHHAKASSDGKKPVWTLYQTSQMDGRYERTAAKHRNMIYQGMFAGGNSIGYIAVSARDSQGTGITSVTEVYEAAKDIIATGELDDAVKAFISGEYPTFCENSGDKALLSHYGYYLTYQVPETYWYKAYIKNGQMYLLVLNHEDANTTVSIPLTSTDNSVTVKNFSATVVDGVSTEQTVTGTNGVFNATIDPYGATLFKISTATDLSKYESVLETPKIDAPSCYAGDATAISWDSVLNAEKYHISIKNKAANEEVYAGFTGTESSYTITLPTGQYSATVSAYDASGNYSSSSADFAVLEDDIYTESTVVKSENLHTVTTTIHNILEQGRLIVVGYKNGAVVDVESRYYTDTSEVFTLEGDIDEIRVMTWNGLLGLVPVCSAEILPASEWTTE